MITQAIREQPFSAGIVLAYIANIFWQLSHDRYGQALYWVAAATITVSATWLMGWGK